MALYKEIVTKAVVGKGKKSFSNNYEVEVSNNPSTVLGCWIINHQFNGYKSNDSINVNGSYDVNIWYSYDNDSKTTVINKKIDYSEILNIKLKEETESANEVIVRALSQPSVSKVDIKDNKIVFDVNKELGVEVVGEEKVKISTIQEEDAWEDLNDDVDEELKKIDNVNKNFL